MNNNTLTCFEIGSLIAGITITDVQNIFSLILMAISIIVGAINLVMLVKNALKDGKIDDQEKQQITQQVMEIEKEIENKINDKRGE